MSKMSLKRRAERDKTLAGELEKHQAEQEKLTKENANNPMWLMQQALQYRHQLNCATSRKARLEELMQRHVTRKWAPAKKAQMVRRLVRAGQEIEQAANLGPQLESKLEQVLSATGTIDGQPPQSVHPVV